MSQRTEKAESIVQKIVATELMSLIGPDAARLTVTAVEVSPDLRHAVVRLGIFGDERRQNDLMKRAGSVIGELQSAVASQLTTKFVPRLELRLDTGSEYAAEIDRLLKRQ
jgi:ribosome-binding factor A